MVLLQRCVGENVGEEGGGNKSAKSLITRGVVRHKKGNEGKRVVTEGADLKVGVLKKKKGVKPGE